MSFRWIFVFAVLSLSNPVHAARSALVVSDKAYAAPQRLVDVGGGRRMNIYCTGHGRPTVVFDAGLGNWSQLWGLVQPAIAKRTQACSYDRAGLGFSDYSDADGSSATIVSDLHLLLTKAQVKPPYVLVGHSYGGMNVRLFADTYPDEVKALVLVDPSTRDLTIPTSESPAPVKAQRAQEGASIQDRANRCINAAEAGFVKGSAVYDECVDQKPNPRLIPEIDAVYQRLQLSPDFLKARWKEEIGIATNSVDQLRRASRSFGAMPLIVLTQSDAAGPDPSVSALVKAHRRLAALSSVGEHRIVPDSSHNIPFDQPEAVIRAIDDVLNELK